MGTISKRQEVAIFI